MRLEKLRRDSFSDMQSLRNNEATASMHVGHAANVFYEDTCGIYNDDKHFHLYFDRFTDYSKSYNLNLFEV